MGGLSIWRELTEQLPQESTIYVADSGNCPYGPRPAAEVCRLSMSISRFLLTQGCKLIIVACNTASAAALQTLRTTFAVPFVGLEPALKPAAQATQSGHIGILATAGTLQGALFQQTRSQHAQGVVVHTQVGTGLVEQVEAGQLDTPETAQLLQTHLTPLLAQSVDQIVLGCTHYPLLMPLMEQLVGGQATLIDPAPAVIRQVKRRLRHQGYQPQHRFYTTGDALALQTLVPQFYREAVDYQSLPPNYFG